MHSRSKAELALKPVSPDTQFRGVPSLPRQEETTVHKKGRSSSSGSFSTVQSRAEGFGVARDTPFKASSYLQGYTHPFSGKKAGDKLSLTSWSSSVQWVQLHE